MSRRERNDGACTRQAILNATEAIMREEGYAAVSSRRVAERAGFKSKLVHYHFKTMDDLFLALYHRSEQQFEARHQQALQSHNPVRALWHLWEQSADTELVAEFIALANHRKAIRDNIARSNDRTREAQARVIARLWDQLGFDRDDVPAVVLAFLMAAISRTLVTEEGLGAGSGHGEVRAFMERYLQKLDATLAAGDAAARTPCAAPAPASAKDR